MKSFREKMSITKLVLLLLVVTLMFIEIWNVVKGGSIDQLFTDVVIMVVSFYFGQKGMEYTEVDSLMDGDLDESKNI